MAFILLIYQTLFHADPKKVIIAFAVLQLAIMFIFHQSLLGYIINVVVFSIFSFLVYRFEDSLFIWLLVIASAGLLFMR